MNNKGVSLVEIIISVAILSILSVSFIQILSGSFSNIMNVGRDNKDNYEAAGELNIAIREDNYYGKNANVSSSSDSIDVLGTPIDIRVIHSKSEDIDSALGAGDPYIYAFVVDPPSYAGQAFIDLDDDQTYDAGEISVDAEILNGSYYQVGTGVLVIPNQSSLTAVIDNINWRVKDGVYIKDNITIDSVNEINIKVLDGDIIINEDVNLEAVNDIVLDSSDAIDIQKTFIRSTAGNIKFISDDLYLNGNNTKWTYLDVDSTKSINCFVNTEIFLNGYTSFTVYAVNEVGATLTNANHVIGNTFD